MKKRWLLLLIITLHALSGCKNNDEFTISGKIENVAHTRKAYLYQGSSLVDSAFFNEKNEFQFIRSGTGPDFYTLVLDGKNFPLVAKNGDEIEFYTNYADAQGSYTVKGSEESEKIRGFNLLYNKYAGLIQDEQTKVSRFHITNPVIIDSIKRIIDGNVKAFSEEALKFAKANKNNLAGFHAINTLDQTQYEKELIEYADDIRTIFPDNKDVIAFVSRMVSLKSVSVGQIAPDFELPDPSGKMIKLSDYRGKYVLLDFWASWCPPCRQENPNIVKRYNTYKSKGFTVLGVSLDDDKDLWLKAIKKDHLTWDHAGELMGWEQRWDGKVTTLYKIDAIPASFLIDREGRIAAKNLTGDDLNNFLQKTLN